MKLVLVTLILAALAEPKKKGIRTQIQEKIKERDIINNAAKSYHYDGVLLCGSCRSKKDQTEAGPCNKQTGNCPTVAGKRCLDGWDEVDTTCQTPKCDKVNCGSDGYCVAPNECVCTALSSADGEGGCYHLRVRGLIGAGIAILVLILSVSACAIIQTALTKKNK